MNRDETSMIGRAPQRRSQRAFTLVEMLCVIAVLGIILVLTVPTFAGMNSTGVRKSAVTKVMGLLDQARGIAITEGRNTYAVFSSPAVDPDSTRWGRACAIYVEDSNFTIVQRSAWQYIPNGVSFKIDGSNGTTSILNRPPPTDGTVAPNFPVVTPSGVQNVALPYFRFDSTGGTDEQDRLYSRVLIFRGTVNPAGGEVALKNVGADGQLAMLDEVRVNPATGRAKYIVDTLENLATPSPFAANP